MRVVRYETGDSKKAKYGWLLGDKVGEIGGMSSDATAARRPKRRSRT